MKSPNVTGNWTSSDALNGSMPSESSSRATTIAKASESRPDSMSGRSSVSSDSLWRCSFATCSNCEMIVVLMLSAIEVPSVLVRVKVSCCRWSSLGNAIVCVHRIRPARIRQGADELTDVLHRRLAVGQADSDDVTSLILGHRHPRAPRCEHTAGDGTSVDSTRWWLDAQQRERGVIRDSPTPRRQHFPEARDEMDRALDVLRVAGPTCRSEGEEQAHA